MLNMRTLLYDRLNHRICFQSTISVSKAEISSLQLLFVNVYTIDKEEPR